MLCYTDGGVPHHRPGDEQEVYSGQGGLGQRRPRPPRSVVSGETLLSEFFGRLVLSGIFVFMPVFYCATVYVSIGRHHCVFVKLLLVFIALRLCVLRLVRIVPLSLFLRWMMVGNMVNKHVDAFICSTSGMFLLQMWPVTPHRAPT